LIANSNSGVDHEENSLPTIVIIAVLLAVLGGMALAQQDKYTLKVPGGLAFSEFRGYESWQVVSISQDGPLMAAILANPEMIDAYAAGPKKMETFPPATVPGTLHDVDLMVKDSNRFGDSGGWGYAVFEYDAASGVSGPVP
jgi:hypothetical protein